MATKAAVKKAAPKPKVERFKTETGTVGEFMGNGWSEITSLGEEFREIVDNAPDNLKENDVNSRREETASAVEGLSEPSVDSSILEELDCSTQIDLGKTYRGRQTQSRACRASNAAGYFRGAAEALQEWLDANDELPDEDGSPADKKAYKERVEELEKESIDPDDYAKARGEVEGLISELEEIADEIDGMDWPGMFG
jgi:hypothetical protein